MPRKKQQGIINRGYQKLLEANNLDYLIKLSNRTAHNTLYPKHNLFKVNEEHLKECVRQFLIQRTLYTSFNEQILAGLGRKDKRLKIALPGAWLVFLEAEGFKAKTINNYFRWIFFILFWYAVGVYKVFLTFFQGFFSKRKSIIKPYVYFDNLSLKNIPKQNSANSKTIVDWYIQHFNDDNFDITHGVPSVSEIEINKKRIYNSNSPIQANLPRTEWLKYLYDCSKVVFISFFNIFKGDFFHAVLLKEYPLIYLTQNSAKKVIGKKYFFHNSTSIFRPLWTYEAEKKGAEIIFYYYSTNSSPLKFDKGYLKEYGNREFMTWKIFYVWDVYQANYVKDYFPDADIKIFGPIWFESAASELSVFDTKKKVISVFDIQTLVESELQKMGSPDRYISTPIMSKFQKDISNVFKSKKDVLVVLKRKRIASKGVHDTSYLTFLEAIYNNDKFIQISPSIDATSIIEKSFLTISFPPTSTAVISAYHKVNTIYYDPTERVDPNDKALCGIRLIQGVEELEKFVINELKLENE